jgi:uncharacterized protein
VDQSFGRSTPWPVRTRGGAVRTPVVAWSRQFDLKNADIEVQSQGKEPLGDNGVVSLLLKMIKQRIESAELYDEGGRTELAQQGNEEIVIILPACRRKCRTTRSRPAIAEAVKDTGAAGMKDMAGSSAC